MSEQHSSDKKRCAKFAAQGILMANVKAESCLPIRRENLNEKTKNILDVRRLTRKSTKKTIFRAIYIYFVCVKGKYNKS